MDRAQRAVRPLPGESREAFAARLDRLMHTCVTCHTEYEDAARADACEASHRDPPATLGSRD